MRQRYRDQIVQSALWISLLLLLGTWALGNLGTWAHGNLGTWAAQKGTIVPHIRQPPHITQLAAGIRPSCGDWRRGIDCGLKKGGMKRGVRGRWWVRTRTRWRSLGGCGIVLLLLLFLLFFLYHSFPHQIQRRGPKLLLPFAKNHHLWCGEASLSFSYILLVCPLFYGPELLLRS